ncbi:S-layer homology domain-containing protein [Virgibacillus halodenitrificans]|uniref:S-layer homology domain-containing protein n=1 Tax=Virgibacillus halodenitrificans TaxID=1482 RepID=UPI001F27799A|nr:S-layer homology domain-containing protein [Virgibacillus halodenitrificans]MCG1027016.1 S-layer homology domain-containing protein [Virgibacillus halodenitrificans]
MENYSDVSSLHVYSGEIAAVTKAGIFSGDHGKFNTYTNITREQMATVLVKAFHLDEIATDEVNLSDKKISKSHRKNVQIMANLGITNQTEDFQAYSNISRDQFATMVVKSMEAKGVEEQKIDISSIGTSEAAAFTEHTEGGRDFEATISAWNNAAPAPEGTVVYVTVPGDALQGDIQLKDWNGDVLTSEDGKDKLTGNSENIFALEADKEGKISFTLIGEMGSYAKPTVFLDNGNKKGEFDAEDTQSTGEKTSFGEAVFSNGDITVQDESGKQVENLKVDENASVVYQLLDQNGKANTSFEHATTFTVKNIGLNEAKIEGETIPRYGTKEIQLDAKDGKSVMNMTAEGPVHLALQASSAENATRNQKAETMFEFKADAELKEGMYYVGRDTTKSIDKEAKEITLEVNGHKHTLSYGKADLKYKRKQISLDNFESRSSRWYPYFVYYKGKPGEADQFNITSSVDIYGMYINPEEVIVPNDELKISMLEPKIVNNPGTLGSFYNVDVRGTIAFDDIEDVKEVTATVSYKDAADGDEKETQALYVNEYGMFAGKFSQWSYSDGGVPEGFTPYDQLTITYTNAEGKEMSITKTYEFDYWWK